MHRITIIQALDQDSNPYRVCPPPNQGKSKKYFSRVFFFCFKLNIQLEKNFEVPSETGEGKGNSLKCHYRLMYFLITCVILSAIKVIIQEVHIIWRKSHFTEIAF